MVHECHWTIWTEAVLVLSISCFTRNIEEVGDTQAFWRLGNLEREGFCIFGPGDIKVVYFVTIISVNTHDISQRAFPFNRGL